jgi:hypothetical protein
MEAVQPWDCRPPHQIADDAQGALQTAERGVRLIHKLLAFARKQRLEPRSADLGRFVTHIEELLRRTQL